MILVTASLVLGIAFNAIISDKTRLAFTVAVTDLLFLVGGIAYFVALYGSKYILFYIVTPWSVGFVGGLSALVIWGKFKRRLNDKS